MNIRFLLISILLMMSVGFLTAQTTDFIGDLDNSIATTDNFLAPLVNPAALGYGNAGGLGWMHLFDENKWQDHYWLVANTEGLSYVFEKKEIWRAGDWHDQSIHTLATGSETFTAFNLPNLYTGLSYKWINNKFNEGNYRTGVLYRPVNSASLGFTLDNPHKAAPSYQFGLGIRPLDYIWKSKAYGLELNADMKYGKEDGDYTMFKPTVGFSSQLTDGVMLKANYNMETESAMLNVSLGAKNVLAGTQIHAEEDNNYGLGYVFMNDKQYLPLLGVKSKSWYTLPVKSSVVTYKSPSYEIGPIKIFDNKQSSVESIIHDIRKAKDDPNISGMLFMNKNFASSLALKQEIIAEIRDFKATGKPVIFYYDNMSNGDYIFAASLADKIYLNPMGSLDLRGISINSPYLKGALNALGIDVYNFRSHPTKTAGNMFSEDEMIPEERAMYESLLGDLYNQMCEDIQNGRGSKLVKDVRTTIDDGPYYMAEDALKAGLVDELVYEADFNDLMKKDYKFTTKTKELPDYMDYSWAHPKKDKIAVIYAQGNIVMGKGTVGKKIAQQTYTELIRKARKNPEYKGIILRIDSGGGSAQASDIIWKEIELAKTENKKPVIVTMTGVAGSGGYYIACNSDYIIADPATITGSIGVIGITFTAQRMWEKLKVNWGTVKEGEHSDFGSMNRQWTQDEKDTFTSMIERTYHDFVSKVAKGRKMEYDDVDKIAQGKIWTGIQGKELGLVDELGGMREAVAKMKELAHLKGDVELVNASKNNDKEFVVNMNTSMSMLPMGETLSELNEYMSLYNQWKQYKTEKVLFATPFNLDEISGQ